MFPNPLFARVAALANYIGQGNTILSEHPNLPPPRVHGNGFIQLDMVPSGLIRLHVWGHPLIPAQSVRTGIHDHVYGITSRVLAGSIVDVSWSFYETEPPHNEGAARPDPLTGEAPVVYRVWEATPRLGADTELLPTDVIGVPRAWGTVYLGRNGRPDYTIEAGALHSTIVTGPAATLMEKTTPLQALGQRPRILVPLGEGPDNSFDRNAFDPALLYGIINEVYPGWRRLLERNGRL